VNKNSGRFIADVIKLPLAERYFDKRSSRKLIFSLTKQFLIGNEPVYQNLQKQVKPVAM
jgi:hypothetical protein